MTTAHRPTFDPPGQGGDADAQPRDLRAQLLEAEAAHFSKTTGAPNKPASTAEPTTPSKRQLEAGHGQEGDGTEDIEAKRRRVLEESRDVDADSIHSSSSSSDDDSDEGKDETEELLRELEKIKKERAEKQAQEERVKTEAEKEDRERDIALGNPLLNPYKNEETKRRWDDDVVFRNQARGTENRGKKEFVNDLLRSDFHKRFMLSGRAKTAALYGIDGTVKPARWCCALMVAVAWFEVFIQQPACNAIATHHQLPSRSGRSTAPTALVREAASIQSLECLNLRLDDTCMIASSVCKCYKPKMLLFLRQVWALVEKDIQVAAVRRPISTTIRAIILPLAIVLIVSYAQYFFNPLQHFGVGSPAAVLSLSDAIPQSSGGRNVVAFVDNGLSGGDISGVIDELAEPFRKAGQTVHRLAKESELLTTCPSSVYLLPLARAVEVAIASRTPSIKPGALDGVQQYIFTKESEEKRAKDTRMSYLSAGVDCFGVVFFLGMVGVVYQMTGSIAVERERGLSQLIDAMMPNQTKWQPQLARLFAHHFAFSLIYMPSWLATGIVLGSVVFIKSSAAITIFYHLTVGLALCSFALVGAACFKKAQLSGIILTVITVVLAVIPQVLAPRKQTPATVFALSLIFPSANYTYFITSMARWEFLHLPMNLLKAAPESPWRLHGVVLWIFLWIQIFVYPVLALVVERLLFSTASGNRTIHSSDNPLAPAVRLSGFSKTYKQHWLGRILKKRKPDVHAVKELNLDAHRGQILMLLGPNGSGKSTTLDCIAGLSKLSGSGRIEINGARGLGIAPQLNVLWDELTTEEHIRILYRLKAADARNSNQDVAKLIEACDLVRKVKAKAKTLSGGQKRKLQLAMMFAGGSEVCCVDEVSSGLDPLSRRKIWDILLAERGHRTMIVTTHFLDEADYLSDHIAILSSGHLKAEGSAAGLKHQYGDGYQIHVQAGTHAPWLEGVERKESMNGTTYQALDLVNTTRVVDALEKSGVDDFHVSGPTLENVFLRLVGTPINPKTSEDDSSVSVTREEQKMENTTLVVPIAADINLDSGKHITPWHQGWILYKKRWMIFRRSHFPMIVAMATALIGAGICPIFLKYFERTACVTQSEDAYTSSYSSYVQSMATEYQINLVGGPSAAITDRSLTNLADIYSQNNTAYRYGSIDSVSTLKSFVASVTSYKDFDEKIALGDSTITPGGFFLGDASSRPTFAWSADPYSFANGLEIQNFLNNMLTNGRVVASYAGFETPDSPVTYNFVAVLFVVYYSLVLCLWPGFYALYPTVERLRNVRALQYSNGVRPLPLWLANLAFDLGFTLVIGIISTALLSVGTKLWYHLPYIFVILFLYGISSSILSYIISMFARSPLAAWSLCASGQVVFCLAYFGAHLGVQSNVGIGDLIPALDKVQFTLGLVSPVANVMRSLFVALNQYTLLCRDASNPGTIPLYGGPILYLVLQVFFFFGILLWWDSGVSPMALLARKRTKPTSDMGEASKSVPRDLADEVVRVKSSPAGLRVLHLSKSFGKNQAVDDVTFGVQRGEVFALLGPNGAGKSTAISLIRGDIPPSSPNSSILVDSSSVLHQRAAARARLGVCPQFDAADLLTVTQHLDFYARVRGVSDPSHNIEEVIQAFGLDAFRHRLAQKLSGGTKRKLSLAIALIGNPSVLLLDEPSSGLDAGAKRVMWDALRQVGRDRCTVLTTHSMEEADALAQRAGVVSTRMLA
ncbi:MAG: hypothetical protein Q9184_005829, partial [Pyrenodesmia sp. 2 TL-2023]